MTWHAILRPWRATRRSQFLFRRSLWMATCSLYATCLLFVASALGEENRYFEIQVVDRQTGRGVPLVELTTVHDVQFVTDSNGVVAIDEPGWRGQAIYFHVRSHGYEFPADGFGFRGVRLTVEPGRRETVKIDRRNVAQRLYRVTGADIYRDSMLVGRSQPLREPLVNAQVLGSDSVLCELFRGKLYWFWGDTNRASYPLGLFHVPGATSHLPGQGGLDPASGVDLQYFVAPDGFARAMAHLPGDGPTWLHGLINLGGSSIGPASAKPLSDSDSNAATDNLPESLYAGYVKVKPPLTVYERGLVKFDEERQEFVGVSKFPDDCPAHPDGHAFIHRSDGRRYVYYAHPFPFVRVPATPEALADWKAYEAFTPLAAPASDQHAAKEGAASGKNQIAAADQYGAPHAWRRSAPPLSQKLEQDLIASRSLAPSQAWLPLRDRDSGRTVVAHAGSTYYNAFRRRWISIFTQHFGTSPLGEVWYAEADTPLGPWCYAVKVVSHDNYSFYNPKQHPAFDKEDGRIIFFEGTYTRTFSGARQATPRYDYNQIMYLLPLDDPRAIVPTAVRYAAGRLSTAAPPEMPAERCWEGVEFFACEQPGEAYGQKLCPIYAIGDMRQPTLSLEPPDGDARPLFYALPADAVAAGTAPLYEWLPPPAAPPADPPIPALRRYSTSEQDIPAGWRRSPQPICRVWPNPRLHAKERGS